MTGEGAGEPQYGDRFTGSNEHIIEGKGRKVHDISGLDRIGTMLVDLD